MRGASADSRAKQQVGENGDGCRRVKTDAADTVGEEVTRGSLFLGFWLHCRIKALRFEGTPNGVLMVVSISIK